jgi:PPOX class probable F420-dependent enzyme
MIVDTGTDFGKRVERRLREEWIAWLTTVDSKGTPQTRPVWFLWDGETFLIYSRPGMSKLAHIGRNPHVSLNLDSDGRGSNIIIFTGDARIDPDAPRADQVATYVEKYEKAIERIRMTPAEFAASFSVAIRVRPANLRGH